MRSVIKSFFLACMLMIPLLANAHGYWFETEGSHKANEPVTIKLYFGDFPAGIRSNGQALDKVKDIKVFVTAPGSAKQQITMKQTPDYWEGSYTPQADGTYEITGINDVRDVQDWTKHNLGIVRPIQYMEVLYKVGATTTLPAPPQYIDLTISKNAANTYTLYVTKKGKPLASQKILLSSFGGEERTIETDAKGNATITLDNPALYVFSIDWIDTKSGKFNGKKYETVRHRLDVSMYK